MMNQRRCRLSLSLSEKLMLAGIVLIVATSFPTNAQITRLFPVKPEISSRALEDTFSNEPYSEKIVYPLPPGVTRPPSTESSTSPSKAPITTDRELTPNDANLSKPPEPIALEILPKVSTQQDIIQFKLESTPTDNLLSLSTTGPLISDEIILKKSTTNVAESIKITEQTIAPVQVAAASILPPIDKSSTSTETLQVKQELTTDGPLIKETIQTTQALVSDHKEITLSTESTTGTGTLPAEIKTTPSPVIPTSKLCTTPIGKTGECKDIRQCPSLLKLLMREPLLVENKLYLQRSQCGFEDENVLACCPDNNVPAPTVSSKWSLLPKPRFCGTMHENRLYGGPQTEIDSYSWMALLEYSKGGSDSHFHCGGALINDRYVVTAAHCVTGLPANWSIKGVRLGEWDVATTMDCSKFNDYIDCSDPHINVSIDEVIPHKDYVPTSKNKLHDIALIRLSIPINSTDFLEPICLPQHDQDNLHAFDDQSLDLVGWGASVDGGLLNNIKQKATAQVIQLNKCRSKYAENNITLEQSQFCVEGRLKNDTCRIDSGGPVISFDTSNQGLGNYYLAGIQSFGMSQCWAEDALPGVYTRVGDYIDWILENIHF